MFPDPSEVYDVCAWDLPPFVIQWMLADLRGVDSGPEADGERGCSICFKQAFGGRVDVDGQGSRGVSRGQSQMPHGWFRPLVNYYVSVVHLSQLTNQT